MQQVYDFNAITNSEIRFRFVLVWTFFLTLNASIKQIVLPQKWSELYCFIALMQSLLFMCMCKPAYQSGIVTYELGKYSLVEQQEGSSGLAVLYSHLSCLQRNLMT